MTTLQELRKKHGQLGERLIQLRKPQQEEIANVAFEAGVVNTMNALEIPPAALFTVMRGAGYEQCGGCEEWFPALELEPSEGTGFQAAPHDDGGPGLVSIQFEPERLLCEECKTAEDGEWAAPDPPEPTTPEEIAAAEAKKQKARDAVLAQEERAAKRQEILKAVAQADPIDRTPGKR